MKAFVTGGTGMLGSNLVHLLVERGHQVRALIRSEVKASRLFGDQEGIRFVVGHIENVEGFAHELSGSDVLFHTAAYFRECFVDSGNHKEKLQKINVHGTIELLKAAEARGLKKAIYVSSGGLIGLKPDGEPGDERTPPSHVVYKSHYLNSKLVAEQKIEEFLQDHKLPVVLILPGAVLGLYDMGPTPSGRFVLDYMHGKIPGVLNGGVSLVDARDVATAMISAADYGRSGERYIVGGRYLDMKDVLQSLEKVSGIPCPSRRIPNIVARVSAKTQAMISRLTGKPPSISPVTLDIILSKLRLDSSKAAKELGISFRPVLDTLNDAVQWHRQQQFGRT